MVIRLVVKIMVQLLLFLGGQAGCDDLKQQFL